MRFHFIYMTEEIDKPEVFTRIFRPYVANFLATAFDQLKTQIKRERKKLKTVNSRELLAIQGTLTKTAEAFFGRASAGLCTAEDMYSWNNPDFLQINIMDVNNTVIVGNIQMIKQTQEGTGEEFLIIRINPSAEFLKGSDAQMLADAMLEMAVKFAKLNNFTPCLPENDENLVLTNRKELIPLLQAKYKKKVSLTPKARIADRMFIETVYLLE